MLIDRADIKPTGKGFRVEKKIAGHPRLRKTFATYEEAEIALTKYLRGEGAELSTTAGTGAVTWRSLFDNAVKRKWRKGKSTTQQDNAERTIQRYLGWDNDVREFDQVKADQLADQMEADMKSLATVSKYLSSVRVMLKEAQDRNIITWRLPKLEHHNSTNGRINFFDYDQEERIINIMQQCCRGDLADLFIMFIETGMRTAEGRMLLWQDVDLRDGLIRIWGIDTKTSESRRVPITGRCKEALLRRKAATGGIGRVFPNASKSDLRQMWNAVRKAEGNTDPDFIWYTTRHTCASRLMRAGVDVKTIQTWLGHKRIETTMRYIQFSKGSLATASDALDAARGVAKQDRLSA